MDPQAQLRKILAGAGLPDPEIDAFLADGRSLTIENGEFFCAPFARVHRLGFLHRGILRFHVLTEDGDDVTKDFAMPGGFAVSFGSAVQGRPADVALSAIGRCELTVWPYERVERQYASSAAWERFGRRVAESLYVRKERRELSFLLRSAAERLAEAREQFGPLLAEIPQYHLASYLGIAPESLSRLRRAASRRGTKMKPE